MTKESENKKQIEMIRLIAKVVSDYFGITIYQLVSKTRKREIVTRRQIAQELSYSLIPHVTQEFVGFELGRQDHTTVKHSIKTVNNLRYTDKKFNLDYCAIHKLLLTSLLPVRRKKTILDRLKKLTSLFLIAFKNINIETDKISELSDFREYVSKNWSSKHFIEVAFLIDAYRKSIE
jgi:hypothetical protein